MVAMLLPVRQVEADSREKEGNKISLLTFDSEEAAKSYLRMKLPNAMKSNDAIGGSSIFVGGTLAEFSVAGVILSTTGKSGGQWAAEVMRWAADNVLGGMAKIFCSETKVE